MAENLKYLTREGLNEVLVKSIKICFWIIISSVIDVSKLKDENYFKNNAESPMFINRTLKCSN